MQSPPHELYNLYRIFKWLLFSLLLPLYLFLFSLSIAYHWSFVIIMPTTFFIPNWFTYSDDRIIDVVLDPKGIFIGCLYNEKDEKCHNKKSFSMISLFRYEIFSIVFKSARILQNINENWSWINVKVQRIFWFLNIFW